MGRKLPELEDSDNLRKREKAILDAIWKGCAKDRAKGDFTRVEVFLGEEPPEPIRESPAVWRSKLEEYRKSGFDEEKL